MSLSIIERLDREERILRQIASVIVRSGAPISSKWAGYDRDEDLIPLGMVSDTEQHFVRAKNSQARIEIFNRRVIPPAAKSVKFDPPVVLKSRNMLALEGVYDNDSDVDQQFTISKSFENGKEEANGIAAGLEVTSTTSVSGGGDLFGFEVSQEFSSTVSSEWSRQTGSSESDSIGGDFPLIAPAGHKVQGAITWEQQDIRRRFVLLGYLDFGIRIGRRRKVKGKGWRWASGSLRWNSIQEFIDAMDGKSTSLTHAVYWAQNQHRFRGMPHRIGIIRERLPVKVVRYAEYKGAVNVQAHVKTLRRPGEPDDE